MSLLDTCTEIQLEMYNAKLMVMRKALKDNGIELSEAEISEKAHAILDGSLAGHNGSDEEPMHVEKYDE